MKELFNIKELITNEIKEERKAIKKELKMFNYEQREFFLIESLLNDINKINILIKKTFNEADDNQKQIYLYSIYKNGIISRTESQLKGSCFNENSYQLVLKELSTIQEKFEDLRRNEILIINKLLSLLNDKDQIKEEFIKEYNKNIFISELNEKQKDLINNLLKEDL